MNSGSINQNDLPARRALCLGHVDDPNDAVARRLRLRTYDRNLFANQRIQQSRFAGIRTAEDADES